MNEKEVVMIPFVAHESSMNRMERANKRLWIAIIVMIICFFIYLLIPSEITTTNEQSAENNDGGNINQNIED